MRDVVRCVFAALAVSTVVVAQADEGIAFERIGAHTWRLPPARGDASEANRGLVAQLVLVQDGQRTWLLGSGPSPEVAREVDRAVHQLTGQAVTDLVNTRAAPELAMGNTVFAEARVWALPDVIQTMKARCPACQARLKARMGGAGTSLDAASLREPYVPVGSQSSQSGRLGPFDWEALPRAPGERTLALRHRADHVVVAQGLLWAGDIPDLRETRSDALQRSLRRLMVLAKGQRLVGEQGPVVDKQAVTDQLRYLDALRLAIAPRVRRGDAFDGDMSAFVLAEFSKLPSYAQRHPLNVQHVWREMEEDLLR